MATTSASITVGNENFLTYVFLNQPNDDFITYIRFKTTHDTPQHGKIVAGANNDKVIVKAGTGLAAIHWTENDKFALRLYYIDKNNLICELKLLDAANQTTDPGKWTSDFHNSVQSSVNSGRTVAANSYLSASLRWVKPDSGSAPEKQPAVFYSNNTDMEKVMMTYINSEGQWDSHQIYNPN